MVGLESGNRISVYLLTWTGCCRARFISLTGQLGPEMGPNPANRTVGFGHVTPRGLIREVAKRVATRSTGPGLWPVAGWVPAEGDPGGGGGGGNCKHKGSWEGCIP